MNKQYLLILLVAGFSLPLGADQLYFEQQDYEELKREQAKNREELEELKREHAKEREERNKQRWQKECDAVATSYFAGYIPEALNARYEGDSDADPVFWFTEDVPVILPGRPYKGFLFAGETNDVIKPEAEKDLANGRSVVCKDLLELKSKNASEFYGPRYKKSNVVIAGTCDEEQCKALKEAYQRDLIWLAAHGKLDENHPYSLTPVFEIKDGQISPKGELLDLKNNRMFAMNLVIKNYIICQFYSLQKTRLSSSYEQIGAIVATGDQQYDEQSVCQNLYFGNLHKILDEAKSDRDEQDK